MLAICFSRLAQIPIFFCLLLPLLCLLRLGFPTMLCDSSYIGMSLEWENCVQRSKDRCFLGDILWSGIYLPSFFLVRICFRIKLYNLSLVIYFIPRLIIIILCLSVSMYPIILHMLDFYISWNASFLIIVFYVGGH